MSSANAESSPRVKLETSMGDVVLQLDAAKAPDTVANFTQYVRDGHYDGLVFHRVIKGFMIQGGGYDASMKERDTRAAIKNEAANGLKNERGSVAMARTSAPHSASSQFFINHGDNDFLDYPGQDGWGYAVFGKVVEGMDVVEQIANTPTGNAPPFGRDVPVKTVVINKASVLDAQ
ncbi:peptidylprolyl isomerase [Panacagrimonas sp.]|uniref:peptidylprolyl isomerase n=1 Tax=Panacagrimonas sp. TaxID=2480088 RepID=UPI003B51923B